MSLKEVKQRILSVKNTQKITSAMKLISAAKLRRAQNAIEGMLPYRKKLDEMLLSFLSAVEGFSTPYTRCGEVKRVAVVAVSSNSSLCGSFNAAIIKQTKEILEGYSALGCENVEIFPVGKKICDALNKAGYRVNDALMSQAVSPTYNIIASVAHDFMRRFVAGELDEIVLVYTHFHSAAKQTVVCEKLLPLDFSSLELSDSHSIGDFIVEPTREALIEQLIPKVVAMRLFTSLLDSVAAEHAARMLAMQIATDNANDLITTLVREYNKSRQQAITNELLDIVAGSMN